MNLAPIAGTVDVVLLFFVARRLFTRASTAAAAAVLLLTTPAHAIRTPNGTATRSRPTAPCDDCGSVSTIGSGAIAKPNSASRPGIERARHNSRTPATKNTATGSRNTPASRVDCVGFDPPDRNRYDGSKYSQ